MIGVAARADDLDVVGEFFELFKTPWEPFVPGRPYDIVLVADGGSGPDNALVLIYGAGEHAVDRRLSVDVELRSGAVDARFGGMEFPLYAGVAMFGGPVGGDLVIAGDRQISYAVELSGRSTLRRIGYDLFAEVRHLLSVGQPKERAHIPTLDIHIALLRECLCESGIPFVEIAPRPHDAEFVCCLTHDIDFYGIRRHLADLTLAGFVWRATVGTLFDVIRARRPFSDLWKNWLAVLSLPLIFLGVRRDIWDPLGDYAVADRSHPATFFLLPFSNRPGSRLDGRVERKRAVAYGVDDIRGEIERVGGSRTEFAVHGIDAWRDAAAGQAELREVTRVTARKTTGVRMHWLYFCDDSGRTLEDAGFEYDSTWGYNDAIGFRAGTLQPFRPLGCGHLLELPLAIMDTAMFYPTRMGLTRADAMARCSAIVAEARRYGGALVINWHDRSLAAERQWGEAYSDLLENVESENVWFASGREAVEWFRWRRSIRFVSDDAADAHSVTIEACELPSQIPPGCVLLHRGHDVEKRVLVGGTRAVQLSPGPAVAVS